MIIDSGSAVNVISISTWNWLKSQQFKKLNEKKGSSRILRAYADNKPLTIVVEFKAEIKLKDKSTVADFYVIENGSKSLLGKNTAMELGVLKMGFDINSIDEDSNDAFPKFKGNSFMDLWK